MQGIRMTRIHRQDSLIDLGRLRETSVVVMLKGSCHHALNGLLGVGQERYLGSMKRENGDSMGDDLAARVTAVSSLSMTAFYSLGLGRLSDRSIHISSWCRRIGAKKGSAGTEQDLAAYALACADTVPQAGGV
jgi:hypothetical protein